MLEKNVRLRGERDKKKKVFDTYLFIAKVLVSYVFIIKFYAYYKKPFEGYF